MLFYKADCKKSKQIKEEYKTLADKMFGIIKVGAIDCLSEEELCEEFGVYDSPIIKIFTEMLSDDGFTFKGKWDWKAISAAASQKMQSFVRTVTEDNYESWIQESPEKKKLLLFTDRKTTAPLFKSLSKTYKDKMMFGEVKKEPKLIANFKVTKIPTLMIVTDPFEYTGEVYEMTDIKIDQLKKFLSTHSSSQAP
jgi:thioredoxin-like negative regulator of GroEL